MQPVGLKVELELDSSCVKCRSKSSSSELQVGTGHANGGSTSRACGSHAASGKGRYQLANGVQRSKWIG